MLREIAENAFDAAMRKKAWQQVKRQITAEITPPDQDALDFISTDDFLPPSPTQPE